MAVLILLVVLWPGASWGYPIFAQNAYENPREVSGRIVCANCHLVQKSVQVRLSQAVSPDTVFDVVVSIPYDRFGKQLASNGKRVPLNIGSVLILPEGFLLASKDRVFDGAKAKPRGFFLQLYGRTKPSILVFGPVSGAGNEEISFPVVAPDPVKYKGLSYMSYPIFFGGNRGRGQVYPTGEKSNNLAYTSVVEGKVEDVRDFERRPSGRERKNVIIQSKDGHRVVCVIPVGLEVSVKRGDSIKFEGPLTLDPNIGGFGQAAVEVVLQKPSRIKGMTAFFFTILFVQTFLVLKKKQFEKVQELSFGLTF